MSDGMNWMASKVVLALDTRALAISDVELVVAMPTRDELVDQFVKEESNAGVRSIRA